jgi:hypothetical protein
MTGAPDAVSLPPDAPRISKIYMSEGEPYLVLDGADEYAPESLADASSWLAEHGYVIGDDPDLAAMFTTPSAPSVA